MTSSSQAATATARNSSPLARCIVPTATDPDTPPDPSSSCTDRMPAACTADSAPLDLLLRPDEHTDCLRRVALALSRPKPVRDGLRLVLRRIERPHLGCRSVEHRDRRSSPLRVAVHVGQLGRQEPVGLSPDLMRRAVVDPQRVGSPAHVDAERPPGERRLEDPLSEIPGEEKACSAGPRRGPRETAAPRRRRPGPRRSRSSRTVDAQPLPSSPQAARTCRVPSTSPVRRAQTGPAKRSTRAARAASRPSGSCGRAAARRGSPPNWRAARRRPPCSIPSTESAPPKRWPSTPAAA